MIQTKFDEAKSLLKTMEKASEDSAKWQKKADTPYTSIIGHYGGVVCPSCGYCPTCGRHGSPYYYWYSNPFNYPITYTVSSDQYTPTVSSYQCEGESL